MISGDLPKAESWSKQMLEIQDDASFQTMAFLAFEYQYKYNKLYRQFCDLLHVGPNDINDLTDIPFLPISFFKTADIKTGHFQPVETFESSGTTGMSSSRHLVKDLLLYEQTFFSCFNRFYGPPSNYCILALLPSYLERDHSSLVYMVKRLIEENKHPDSGFFLHDYTNLSGLIHKQEVKGQRTLLIGVTYALLDFASSHPQSLKNTIIMETGGMKGRKRELLRTEVHNILTQAFEVHYIHSEYGMTELLSQAYSKEKGLFETPPWMKVLLRQEDDPLSITAASVTPQTGIINVIDLANIYSCCFIASDDLGKLYPNGSFEVLGRVDNADIRGCSLLSV